MSKIKSGITLSSYRYALIVVFPVFLLLATSTAIGWWHLTQSADELRQDTLSAAELRGRQLDDAVAKSVSMLFDNVDSSLISLTKSFKEGRLARFQEEASQITHRFPEGSINQIAIIDSYGYLLYSNKKFQPKLFLGDREHFIAHKDTGVDSLFVSKPILGKVSNKWSIQFTRPILENDKFLGVVVVSLSPEYLEAALLDLPLASDDSLYLVRNSGEVLARNKDMDKVIGFRPTGNLPYFNATGGSGGSYVRTAQFDGVQRLYAWRYLKNYPVVVIVGLGVNTLMKPAEEAIQNERTQGLVITLVLWILSIFAILLTLRIQSHIKRREDSEYAATHDALTGLANRAYLNERLGDLIKESGNKNSKFALLFVDLDAFKSINDGHGHAVGDAVLQAVGKRILGYARTEDIVARIGGDEFIVVLPSVTQRHEAELVANRIQEILSNPIRIEQNNYAVGASIGVSVFPDDGLSINDLIKIADQAMYSTKAKHKTISR